MTNRKKIEIDIIKMLLARSGNRCALPNCNIPIYNNRNILIGEFAHINAVGKGPRYDASLNSAYIDSYENILLLCPSHHTEIDKDEIKYTVPVLQKIKSDHENRFKESVVPSELIESAVKKYLDEIRTQLQQKDQPYYDIDKKLITILNIISKPAEDLYNFPEHSEQIKKLKEQGSHKAVLSLLEDFKARHWKDFTEEEKYKWQVNLALTYFDLNENTRASENLIGLSAYSYKTEGTNALISLGYLMSNSLVEAERYAMISISETPQEPNAYISLIRINSENKERKIEFTIPESLKSNIGIQIALAKAHEEKNEFEEACSVYSRINIDGISEIILKNDLKSYYAIALTQSIPHLELIYKGSRNKADIDKVRTALKLFDESIEYYRTTDLFPSRYYALINRGVLYKISGEFRNADKDFTNAIDLNRTYIAYRYLLLNKPVEEWPQIIEACEQLDLSENEKIELSQIEAERLLTLNEAHKAWIKLNSVFDIVGKNPESNEPYYLLLSDINSTLQKTGDIQNTIDFLRNKTELKFAYYFLSLKYQIKNESLEGYEEQANILLVETQRKNVIWVRSIVFGLFCSRGDFKKAEKVLRPICEQHSFNEYSRKFIQALYNCGYYKEVSEWINAYISNGLEDEYLIDILSSIYDYCDRVIEAIELIETFLKKRDSNILKIKLAFIYCDNNELELSKSILEKIDKVEKLTFENVYKVSVAYARSGLVNKGLELAYKCRMDNFDNPRAHSLYIEAITSNCLNLPEYKTPEKVLLNSYVRLNSQNSIKEIILVQQPAYKDEVSIQESLAMQLLGNVVGCKINIDGNEFTIDKILTKYSFALNKSLELFTSQFRDPTLSVNKITPALTNEEQRQEFLTSIENSFNQELAFIVSAYQSGLPYEVISKNLNENCVHYWEKQISNPALPLIAINGRIEVEQFESSITEKTGFIFDIFSILIISFTDSWHLIEKLPNKKYITSSVLRILEYEITSIDQHISIGDFFIVKPGTTNILKRTITTNDLKARRKHFEELKSKITKLFIGISAEIPTDMNLKYQDDQIYGHSGNDILIAAKENEFVVISEDALFREKLRSQFNVATGSTASVAYYLLKKDFISKGFHENYSLTLVNYNYINILVNDAIIRLAFDRDFFSIGPTVKKVLFIFRHISVNERIKYFLNFLKNLFSDAKLKEESIFTALSDLTKLYLNYEKSYDSKTLLANKINGELQVSPETLEKINKIIDLEYYG